MISVYLLLDLQCSTISDMAEHHIFQHPSAFRLHLSYVLLVFSIVIA